MKGTEMNKNNVFLDNEQEELIEIVANTVIKNPITVQNIINIIPLIGELEHYGINRCETVLVHELSKLKRKLDAK